MRVALQALAGMVLAVVPANAEQTARRDTLMDFTVSSVCRLGAATMSSSQNASFEASSQGGAIALNALADRNTARALPASISMTFDGVCNEPQFIRITSTHGGLKPEQSAGSGGDFLARVDYTATLGWGANQASLSTDGATNSSAGLSLSGAQSGAVTLQISIPAGSQPLVAGDYSDVLTVEFVGNL